MSAPSWYFDDTDHAGKRRRFHVSIGERFVWFHIHEYDKVDPRCDGQHLHHAGDAKCYLSTSFGVPIPSTRQLVKFIRKNIGKH